MKELQLPRQVQMKWKAELICPKESRVVLRQCEEGTTEAKVTWHGRGSWVTKVMKRKAPLTHNTGDVSGLDTPASADVASCSKLYQNSRNSRRRSRRYLSRSSHASRLVPSLSTAD